MGFWLAAASTQAVSPRAYVSVSGNDANACSNPATPCRTFTGAIAQTASGGEVVVLDSGTFGGGTIVQAVTINAPAGVAALAATPITVSAGVSDVVTLRGITFVSPSPGVGTALLFSGGAGLNVESCVFHGWYNGIVAVAAGALNVTDTTVRESSNIGINIQVASGVVKAAIERTQLLSNGVGLYVGSRAKATIKDSVAAHSPFYGFMASSNDASSSELNIEGCVATHNGTGVLAADTGSGGGSTIRISNSTVTDNGNGLFQYGGNLLESFGNNRVRGNTTNTLGTISGVPLQ
jgi:hypothetical protein